MTLAAPAEISDRELIAHVVAGDSSAFEQLVRRHNQRLYRAARAIARSDSDAEDVLQQTWLEVFRHLGQFRGDAAFTTWATRIAINAAIAHTRRQPVVAEVRDEPAGETPGDEVERVQLGKLLEACLQRLPQGNREVMVLRDVLELDTAETAACLGLSEEAVRVRLHRARSAVAAALAEQMDASDIYSFDGERCERVTRHVMRVVSG